MKQLLVLFPLILFHLQLLLVLLSLDPLQMTLNSWLDSIQVIERQSPQSILIERDVMSHDKQPQELSSCSLLVSSLKCCEKLFKHSVIQSLLPFVRLNSKIYENKTLSNYL